MIRHIFAYFKKFNTFANDRLVKERSDPTRDFTEFIRRISGFLPDFLFLSSIFTFKTQHSPAFLLILPGFRAFSCNDKFHLPIQTYLLRTILPFEPVS